MSDVPQVLHFPSLERREDKHLHERPDQSRGYVEFAVGSNFSFLRGASHPEELMRQAEHVGLAGLGLCDRNSVAGVVRAHLAKRENGLKLRYHPGVRLVFADGTPDILAYPRDRPAWGRLCRLLTAGNLRAEKGDCILYRDDLLAHAEGLELVAMPACTRDAAAKALAKSRSSFAQDLPLARSPDRILKNDAARVKFLSLLREAAPGRVRLAAAMHYRGNDRARLAARAGLARRAGVPLIAVNDVLYHHPDRRQLQDVLTCIREHVTIDTAGRRLAVNAERHLKPPAEMARLFGDVPEAIGETLQLSGALTFSLDQLEYEYPDESVEGFATPQDALVHLAYEGASRRYPGGIPDKVRQSLAHELALIASRQYAPYFLTVYDIVRFARSQDILCQGRGSAANSAVCFCLGVTEVDPNVHDLLFERFISIERNEPPDVDVDFEHERREEVIQYIYGRYGRARTGIAATVISYRGRSAIREVGKVFGLSEDIIGALASSIWGMGGGTVRLDALRRAGLDPGSPRVEKIIGLAREIQGFPRHLSQHVGGFVITRSRLDEVVPVMNGAMEARTHVEWDKDDLDALGILKVDVLGLGMLTCIRKAFELVERHYGDWNDLACPLPSPRAQHGGEESGVGGSSGGRRLLPIKAQREGNSRAASDTLHRQSDIPPTPHPSPPLRGRRGAERPGAPKLTLYSIPKEDPAVYRMLCRADSIGVFQVESRAQMSMLPRLRPEKFYDLVIEVAIVRPGPIQGDMVHPYLRRRQKQEKVEYPSEELKAVLHTTLGVPLFQEQAMKIAIVAGGFTPGEADRLRRAMATFKRTGTIGTFRHKMIEGMVAKKYTREFAERCFSQIEGFGEYGFPESHAASFALLVYASAWLKCRYPDVFAAALLNAQPMGFYAPAQIVRDVREHGVEVRPVDVNHSDYDATLEPGPHACERLHELHREMRQDIRATHAMRLGLREVKGLSEDDAKEIMAKRGGGYDSVRDLWLRTALSPRVLERLADADAFGSLGLSRRPALWAVKALGRAGDQDDLPLLALSSSFATERGTDSTDAAALSLWGRDREGGRSGLLPLPATPFPTPPSQGGRGQTAASDDSPSSFHEPEVALPPMPLGEEVVNDYRFIKLSLRAHPAGFLRDDLSARRIIPNEKLRTLASGAYVRVSGLVTIRQRPGSAQGVIFMTIEDETAIANIIVWPKIFERFRPVVLGARYVCATGKMQQESGVIHVVADRLEDLTPLLGRLLEDAPPISALARADAVKRPHSEDRPLPRQPGRIPLRPGEDASQIAADLDASAPGSAHVPTRRAVPRA